MSQKTAGTLSSSLLEMRRTTIELLPTAEPFFFPGGPTGCLLVHGFTGTPKEMRWMGEYLAAQGHTVLGIRLAGHATRPDDMLRTRWQDWLAGLEDGWEILNSYFTSQAVSGAPIFVAGLSMGGVLGLILASQQYATRYPLAGVIAMSTPYSLRPDPRLRYIKVLHWLLPRVVKGPPDWRNLEAAEDHVDYPYYPTRAIAELRDAVDVMQATLPTVHTPALLVHSLLDEGSGSFQPQSMQKIYDRLGSPDKQMLWLENSGHVITREPEREIIFQAADNFIRRVSKGTT